VQALAALDHSVRTGEPAFDHVFGSDYSSWLASAETHRREFRESQSALNRLELMAIHESFRWQDVTSIVDVGGGDGSLVAALLEHAPALTGVVFDVAEAAAGAHERFRAAGLADRATVVHGHVLRDEVPAAADVYVMRRVLAGLGDADAILAAANVRHAMAAHSRLLVMEPLRRAPGQLGVSPDLQMLALGLGRVRTADEIERILLAAGLRATATCLNAVVTTIEAEVASR